MIYEWDPGKATGNLKKHQVSFDEAKADESRFITIGTSDKGRVLFVAHVDRGEDRIRLISARSATKSETHGYQESRKPR